MADGLLFDHSRARSSWTCAFIHGDAVMVKCSAWCWLVHKTPSGVTKVKVGVGRGKRTCEYRHSAWAGSTLPSSGAGRRRA